MYDLIDIKRSEIELCRPILNLEQILFTLIIFVYFSDDTLPQYSTPSKIRKACFSIAQ